MFKNFFKFLSVVFLLTVFAFSQNSFAQLSGSYTIPGAPFATLKAAVDSLNLVGSTGGVTFNVTAGYTESITAPITVTATGAAGNAIIFQKSGGGANPLITRTDIGTITTSTLGGDGDAVIRLNGTDYITFNGIDVAATTQTIEYGYYTFKPSATDGCQFVTIQNCGVTLTKGTSLYVMGIYISNGPASGSVATGVTVTAASGINSNIAITGNIIQNVYAGIYVRGSSATGFYDSDVVIGQSGAGNIIQNFGINTGSANTSYGVYFIYVNNPTVAYNTISNAGGGGAAHFGTFYGIFYSTVSGNVVGSNNAFTINNVSTTSSTYHIYNANLCTSETYNNNTFAGSDDAGSLYFIYSSNATNNKTISGNSTSGTVTSVGGTLYCYYNFGSPTGGTETLTNNNFSNISVTGVTSSGQYGIYSNTAAAQAKVVSGNTISNWTSTSTGSLYALYPLLSVTNQVYNNTVFNLTHAGSLYGLYLSGTGSVYNNNVYGLTTTTITTAFVDGIYVTAGTLDIYNNFVSDLNAPASTSTTAGAIGIYLSGGTTVNLYYNTVYLKYVSTAALNQSAALYVGGTTPTTVNMYNNVFVNDVDVTVGTRAMAFRKGTTAFTNLVGVNNNLYYAGVPSATHVIYYDGTNTDQDLTAYKSRVTPRESASVTQMPDFINSTVKPYNLHINPAIPTQLESGGTPVAITVDYDGEARNNPPDIGADEFIGTPLDLVSPIIVYTPLLNTNSVSNRTLVATITDPGSGVNGITLTAPRIYYKKSTDANAFVGNTGTDNGWKWTEATGTSPFSFTIDNSIIFGGSVTTGDVIQYFVVAQDLATTPNTGANPSLGFVGTSVSSITSAPTTPSSYTISQAALAGNYTVGLTLFNQVTGNNIYFDKVVTKVMKEVDVVVPQEVTQYAKGQEPQDQNQTSFKPQTVKQLMEVEEISWIPMQNGQQYLGDLYIKKIDSPGFNYPVGTDGIYATITAAVADLNLRGVNGATTFLLNDATYTTGETYPIVINVANEGNFPTATNSVTIKPNTGVTALVQGAAAAGQIFKILNSYVSIDGSNAGGTDRSLTIENTSATTPQVVVFGSTGTTPIVGNTLKNCIIRNGVTSSTAIVVSDGTAPGTAGYFNNITIQNNSIGKAYMGVYNIAVMAPGNGGGLLITGNDLNNATPNHIALVGLYVQGVDGATVSNNNIGNYTTTYTSNITGVWFATGTVNSNISGNTIGPINITTAPPRGIVVTSAVPNANVVVNDNTLTGIITSYAGANYGIYVFSTTSGVSVLKNKISNIKNTNSGGYSAIGIALGSSLTAANITVANNFIWDVAGYGYTSTTTDNGYGINLLSGGGYNVYFNSIALTTEQTSATGNPAALIINSAITTPASLDIRDNIFATFQTVGAQRYALLSNAANTVFSNINYNDWYSLGPNLGYIGRNRLDLDSLRAGTGQDLQSISGDPNFVSTSDLHINTSYNTVSNNGQYLAAVPTDIDGTLRSASTPDIGADEYIYVAPSVIDPSGVTATAISSSQIDVAFTPNASSNNVVIVYNLDGVFTAPAGTPTIGGSLANGTVLDITITAPYSHLGLTANTHYFYKLFSYNGTMYSDGVAVDATTLCGVFAAPWTQDFESGVFPPLCWSLAGSATGLWNSSSAVAAGISGYGVGSYSAFADFWGVSAGSQDLISFDYDASTLTSAQLKFDWAYDIYFTNTDTLKIFYSVDAGINWVLLATGYNGASGAGLFNLVTVSNGSTSEYGSAGNPVLSTDWMTITFGLPAGTNKVKFTAASDYGNNLFVDNIKIEAAPAHDIGVTALTRNYGTLLERIVETGFSRDIAENSVDKNGNKIENVSIRILYPEQKENPPEAPVNLLAVVENFGGAVENSYQVGWSIDGTPQTSVSNTQPLEVGDIDTLTLTWAAATAGSHSSRAWTILGTDANAANDSSGILAFYVCPDNAIYCEQFEQGLIPPTGWQTYNQDGGTATPWFVGNPTVFTAYESSGYIANNYQRANGFFIDDWLVTSNTGGIPLGDADVDSLVFWMRSPDGSTYPDSVEIRLSTTGQAVGDFTVLLDHFKVPTTGWTRFAYVLPEATNRYIAFRYLMYDGGTAGNSSDYIGLDLVQILRYTVSNTFQLTVNVADGWNMVSIPGLHPTDQNVSTWWQYRDLGANVFRYAGGYQPVTTAAPGTGYWMKHAGALTYDTGGEWPAGGIQIVTHDPLTAASGWNLIGGYELSVGTAGVTTIPSGLQEGPIYKYSGGYQTATTLDPGYGYWIKLSASGQIIIPETLAKDGKPVEYFPDSWGKIVLTDAAGINYTLYAVDGEVNLSQYELPPAPPTGMFDIRYSSGRIAEDLNSAIKTIDMSGVTYPLTVRVEGMDIRLMDETGKTVNVNLKDGEDIVISDATIQKLMVSGELIPAVYSLEQNYPNPFNPSTMIEFSLPENVGNVKLSIYNALGEKVAELVNTALVAGKYSYQWNAQNVATGMYIYELRTDKFVSVKKMLLLK